MKCNQRLFAIVVVTLIAISLLVLSVSATPSIEGPVMGTGSSTITGGFAPFAAKHAMDIKGDWYLTHPFNKKTLYEYIECENHYLQENPGAEIVLNLKGHGWFNNNEVVARSDIGNVVVMQDVIGQLSPELEWRQLKWVGIRNAEGEWVDVVWGALQSNPTPYFLNFAKDHAIEKEGEYYLTPRLDKDTVFAYLESEVMHLAQRSSNAIITNITPEFTPDYDATYLFVRLYAPSHPPMLIATTFDRDGWYYKHLQDRSVYPIAELRKHPEKYTGWHIVWKGQYSVVCIEMTEINDLLQMIWPYGQQTCHGDLYLQGPLDNGEKYDFVRGYV
jgi:hypothetical protein